MFAVIRTGGKQYKVVKDDVLVIEKVAGDVGSTLKIEEVLMLGGDKPKHGAPLISGASSPVKSSPRARAKRSSPSRKSAARTRTASAVIASPSPR